MGLRFVAFYWFFIIDAAGFTAMGNICAPSTTAGLDELPLTSADAASTSTQGLSATMPPTTPAALRAMPAHRFCCSKTRGGRRRPCGAPPPPSVASRSSTTTPSTTTGSDSSSSHDIVNFYRYTPLPDAVAFVASQLALCERLGVTSGRLLVSAEGVNGTLSGPALPQPREQSQEHEEKEHQVQEERTPPPPAVAAATVTVADAEDNDDDEATKLRRFYTRHITEDPALLHQQLAKVPFLVAKYEGDYPKMWRILERKRGSGRSTSPAAAATFTAAAAVGAAGATGAATTVAAPGGGTASGTAADTAADTAAAAATAAATGDGTTYVAATAAPATTTAAAAAAAAAALSLAATSSPSSLRLSPMVSPVEAYIAHMSSVKGFEGMDWKRSSSSSPPYGDAPLCIKVKRERFGEKGET